MLNVESRISLFVEINQEAEATIPFSPNMKPSFVCQSPAPHNAGEWQTYCEKVRFEPGSTDSFQLINIQYKLTRGLSMIPDTFSLMPFLLQTSVVIILFKKIYSPPSQPAKRWWKMNYLFILILIIISTCKHWFPYLSIKVLGWY